RGISVSLRVTCIHHRLPDSGIIERGLAHIESHTTRPYGSLTQEDCDTLEPLLCLGGLVFRQIEVSGSPATDEVIVSLTAIDDDVHFKVVEIGPREVPVGWISGVLCGAISHPLGQYEWPSTDRR